eukprot:TRINITY_DN15901_c0_g1_i1.p1 TRINITY_DN15901_c0_g1~~TRINITY_DN15901_c0_g1_i1.p1  ORF type:complete len:362 (+),score=56.35 TRINITY_DN15901_c0_g1_i1:448-1533(+)
MDADRCFLLNTGAKIPAVGLGTWLASDGEARSAVRSALEVGYKSIDCAHLYGNEIEVGEALEAALAGGIPGLKREELFVTSKLWFTNTTYKHVTQACQLSLKNLRLAYLDLFLIHWPFESNIGDATDPPRSEKKKLSASKIRAVWRGMEEVLKLGLVRAIGLSNFSKLQIEDLLTCAEIVPAVNQVELHPLWRQDELIEFCQSKGIHVSAHTPLGTPGSVPHCAVNSMDEAVAQASGSPRVGTRSVPMSVHAPMLKDAAVIEIAARLGRTPAQVILRWGIQRGTSVLPRSVRPDRIKSNFDVFGWELSPEDWKRVNSLEPQVRLIDSSGNFVADNGSFNAFVEDEEALVEVDEGEEDDDEE